MAWLLYGIGRESARLPKPLPPGMADSAICLLSWQGLQAVVAEAPTTLPTLANLRAFSQAVEALHACDTVIPFRYGQCLPDTNAVHEHLARQAVWYSQVLEDIEDCSEIGIRLLHPLPAPPTEPGCTNHLSGRAYLASRRHDYAARDGVLAQQQAVRQDVLNALAGQFLKWGEDRPRLDKQGLLSLFFLVPRTTVAPFCEQARKVLTQVSAQVLVSGPWPPYNFVAPVRQKNGLDY